jgi:hypothetical protein
MCAQYLKCGKKEGFLSLEDYAIKDANMLHAVHQRVFEQKRGV